MRRRFWLLWAAVNIAWLVGIPWLCGVWLAHEVRAEYASGARISTDGDSISVVVFGIAILNTILVVLVNVAWSTYAFVKRRRAT
jgi:hypothetical protein